MRKRISIGFCLLLSLLLVYLAGCGRNSEVSDNVTVEGRATSQTKLENQDIPESVTFGSYPKVSENAEPIEWIVVDQDENSVLLLSKHILASIPWHGNQEPITWDQSDIRTWLNGEFLNTAFSEEERSAMILSDLETKDDMNYGTTVGENTRDTDFLLSASEALDLLDVDDRRVSPTSYAISQGAYTNGDGNSAWWLRSPGMTETSPAYIASSGEIGSRAHEVNETIIGVRPAIWVKSEVLGSDENGDN